jgi:hypothetical protein
MEKSSNLKWKAILFCLAASSLVLSGGCRKKSPRVIPITVSGNWPNVTVTAGLNGSGDAVSIKNHESVEWRNDTKSDMLICMDDADGNLTKRAFVPMFFYVPRGGKARSGPVRQDATKQMHPYSGTDDPSDHAHDNPSATCDQSSTHALSPNNVTANASSTNGRFPPVGIPVGD